MDLYPEARLEVEEGTLMLETLMENAVDKNFDKLEIWVLRNVFALSRGDEELVNWIKLGHYEVSIYLVPSFGCRAWRFGNWNHSRTHLEREMA
jgi:hypothetical protein